MNHGAILLAAGASERMGFPKALLKIGDETFLQHILDQLIELDEVAAVAVVLGANATAIKEAVDFRSAVPVHHRGYKLGMFSSVRAGARAVWRRLPDLKGALVCLVDMPAVSPDTYRTLIHSFQADKDDVVIAAYQGEGGHPVLLSRTLVERLADVAKAEPAEDTLAEFLDAHAERRRFVDANDPAVLQNVNTPEAYRSLFGS